MNKTLKNILIGFFAIMSFGILVITVSDDIKSSNTEIVNTLKLSKLDICKEIKTEIDLTYMYAKESSNYMAINAYSNKNISNIMYFKTFCNKGE
jgi:hypothetical protein